MLGSRCYLLTLFRVEVGEEKEFIAILDGEWFFFGVDAGGKGEGVVMQAYFGRWIQKKGVDRELRWGEDG